MPAGQEYLKPDVIQQVQRLDLRARFIVEGFLSGLHASPYHGFSVEFSEHRKYVPGDDPRMIDWNVFAKTDRFFIKKYQAETNLDCYLLVDCSASMDYPRPVEPPSSPSRMSKLDYAICLAAALGYMMISQQDSVGLATFDTKLRAFLPPKSKRAHLMSLLAHLANVRPRGQTGLSEAIHHVASRVSKRSLMVLLSDLLAEPDPIIEALHHLRFRGHDLIVFCVLDVTEATFPFEGQLRFEDVESSARIEADPLAVRAAYLAELRTFIERYRNEAADIQADFVQVDTSMTFDKALIQFLIERQRRF